jgi:hypothetical protein
MTSPSATSPGTEKRRDPRRDVSVPARLSLLGLTVEGWLANVSARGVCFLTTSPHLRVAEANFVEILFSMTGADGAPHDVRRHVRITRIEAAEVDGSPGRRLGVAWDDPLPFAV